MAVMRLGFISTCIKLKVRQTGAIKSNNIVVFAAILLALSNLNADLMTPAMQPF